MGCKDDSSWLGAGTAAKDECVTWSDLIALRKKYNEVYDELKKYNIELKLPATGRNKYGDSAHNEEIEPLATINGFISIKMDMSGSFDETRFIITGGDINNRIPANSNYNYNHDDYGDWIVYIKSDCYGCGGWKLDESGAHYPRYMCCGGDASTCGDMDSTDWKSQDYVGRSVDGGICNFGRTWASNYMDVVDSCISACPKKMCVCDSWPDCGVEVSECCNINLKYTWSNHFDFLGPVGTHYGDPNCPASAARCPQNHEKRGIKWIGSHEPSSNYGGYVTQVIKAQHLNDIWDAIKPAFGGGNRTGGDWNYCKGNNKKWKEDNNVDLENLRLRECKKCCFPGGGEPICACQVNDLMYVLGQMLTMTCTCHAQISASSWKGKTMFKIVHPDTPSLEDCPCDEICCKKMAGGPYPDTDSVSMSNRVTSGCSSVGPPCGHWTNTPSCSGVTTDKYIQSTKEWPDCFMDFKPQALVSGVVDNWGSIGGALSSNQNTNDCVLGSLAATYVVPETFAGSTGKFKMKVKATSVNASHGGPHGWQSATAVFSFKKPITDPCVNFTSIAEEPCDGGGGGYTSMNFFPIGPGNAMAFV